MAATPVEKFFVVIGGKTYTHKDNMTLDVDCAIYSLPGEYDEVNGCLYARYSPGERTWTITIDGNVIYRGTDAPVRTETGDGVTYTFPALPGA
jgi:hypothetical protein